MTTHDIREEVEGPAGPRARITYPVVVEGVAAEKELPFVVGVLGDFSGWPDEPLKPLRDRRFVRIDRDNFDRVMDAMKPRLALRVENTLTDDGSRLAIELRFRSMDDFKPAWFGRQVEPLRKLLELRNDLRDLAIKMEQSKELEQLLEPILRTGDEFERSGEPLDDILDRIAAAVQPNAPSRGGDLASTLVGELRHGWLPFDTDVPTTLASAIRAIDSKLSAQLTVILQHPDFQKLEGAWRGLHYLVANSEIGDTLRIKVLNVSKRELFQDVDRATEIDQSQIFKKVYENELGSPGGTPFTLLIGDYEFTNDPEDIDLLSRMSNVAAASHCPFIGAASPQLFGLFDWAEISRPRNLERIFKAIEYTKWRSFRESEDSRFVALVLPRTAARPPFDRGSGRDREDETGFVFEEIDPSKPVPHEHMSWMNSAFVLGVLLARTFRQDGLFTALMSSRGDEIKGLPTFAFTTDDGGLDWIGPTQVAITEERCRELSRLGFLPLCRLQDTRSVVFFGGRSVHKPKAYARPEHTTDADLASRPRVRIAYPVEVDGGSAEKELPFVVGVLGDFSGQPDEPLKPLRDRKFVRIDRDDFDCVMDAMKPRLALRVENTLTDDGSRLAIELRFRSMEDFGPGRVIQQVAPLARLFAARTNLRDLISQVDRSADLEMLLERILVDAAAIRSLYEELNDVDAAAIRSLYEALNDQDHASRPAAAGEESAGIHDQRAGVPLSRSAEDQEILLWKDQEILLWRVLQAVRFVDSARAREMIGTLISAACERFIVWDRTVSATIEGGIPILDAMLSRQVAAILHHADFQKLEGSWRGLSYLVSNSETSPTLKIKVLNVSQRELWNDLGRTDELDRSRIYDKICRQEFGLLGGEPYGILLGDYEFTDHPEDVELLGKLSNIAAAAFCPFIAAAAPQLFGLDSWRELPRPRDLERIFDSIEYAKWRGLRESEGSRFVALVLPRVLARLPHGVSISPIEDDGADFASVIVAIVGKKTMATQEPHPTAPKAFVSYSWDDDAHKEWVKQLATRLRADGVDVTLDRWDSAPGDQIPAFMERAVRENDFVIAVCTPRFKERSDGRGGGVGYEGDIMTAYAFTGGDKRKFIPVLRRGSWSEAAPTWLLGRAKIDLSTDRYSESEYGELLRTLHGAREEAPPIGPRPNFGDRRGAQARPSPPSVAPPARPPAPRYQASIRLPYTMFISRFMICIKLIVHELVADGRDAEELVSRIGCWIDGYVDSSPDADERRRASHPLREAKVVLEQIPGRHAIVVHLRPWLPLEELSSPVQMEVRFSTSTAPGFAFEEVDPSRPVPHDQLSWMNASYLMGVVMTRAFAGSGECTSISDPRAGGRLERLPGFSFRTDDGDLDRQGPTEVVLAGRRYEELSDLGFLPLCYFKDTDSAVFFGARTARKPETYWEPEAARDAVIASRLPCIMFMSRFMICINLMVHELVAKGRDAEELVSRIGRWIDGYVDSSPDADERRRASHPLREAKVVLEQIPGALAHTPSLFTCDLGCPLRN